ncbi:hypothetical protein CKW46_14010 [Mycobacterium liflandii]|nr:hypothetical protein CKW46_14010 [Mycobacterium liflandii]
MSPAEMDTDPLASHKYATWAQDSKYRWGIDLCDLQHELVTCEQPHMRPPRFGVSGAGLPPLN